ncbi:protein NLRC3-like isoform X2 [Xiphias gladius]|uniref:protein NLRC3-like isoform X2 n=1 Tax=Xiphias gladius TaxID=8245 RepID=UPI001A994306|nr:protein NLRC3-like isoform X2 [Xiphias gladius]
MGNQCSALRKGNIKEKDRSKLDQKNSEVSTIVKSGEKSPLLQRRSSLQEETLRRQEEETSFEENGCSGKCSTMAHEYAVVQDNTTSPHHSETHDPAPVTIEEKEAYWVDNNRANLIQSVTSVMLIVDEMHQQRMIHKEIYANIEAAGTSMEQMRVLYGALTSTKAKSAFFRILREIEPATCETEDVVGEIIKKHKAYLRERLSYESEGTERNPKDEKSLDQIYTELHIIQGESEHVNKEHEIWEIEDKARIQTAEGTKINCNDIFKSTPEDSVSPGKDRRKVRAVRTVMTKGIAGIGKTVSVKKFILDWADGRANQDLDFIFVLPFRELNLVIDKKISLETLVREFHPELKKIAVSRIFANRKVLFIFDGLDESQLQLNFKTAARLTDATEESSVDTLVTNLIREHLLPSALVWITSRPGAVQRIPRQYVYQWTEVRGFNDPQKLQYFRRRVQDKVVAEKIINYITMSRSLYIMCHIPIFCWIAAKVFEQLLLSNNVHDENIKIPTTLTEMYTHFLIIQMQVATEKYDNQDESDTEEIFKSNKEFIFKLGRMAFEHLKESKIIFHVNDLKKYGIDTDKAGVHCGLCTEIFKEESVFNRKKLYCFVHLTVQEYFAALFVYHSFATKKIDSLSLKDFLLKGSEEHLKSILDADPVDLPLDELIEITIANSALRKTGELDMFLRFLIGMSLQSTHGLLQGLIQQTEEHTAVVEEIRKSLTEIDLGDCSPERCLNLVHCLIELKDSSLYDTVQQYLRPNHDPETQLSPFQCSALADSILMSNTPLDEFNLKKYRPSAKGIFRLVPAVRNCRKARISGVHLNAWLCETISSALQMPNSVLTELHLMNNTFYEKGIKFLTDGLINSKIEALSLSHNNLTEKGCRVLASALSSKPSHLREVDLSYNDLQDSGVMALCHALMNPHCGLKALRLSFCKVTGDGCRSLASALRSDHCSLRELDLSFNHLADQGVQLLTEIQRDSRCSLEKLNVDQNEECWFDLTLLRQYACDLTLDLNTASVNIILTEGNKMATWVVEKQPYPDHPDRFESYQVLCEEGLTGRHYWEVECYSADVGVAYKSIDRVADCSSEVSFGRNEKSWCWFDEGSFCHNNSCLKFMYCSTRRSTMGVYLDWPAGILSFFEVLPDKLIHRYTVHTTFTEPLHPGFTVAQGSIYLCKIK